MTQPPVGGSSLPASTPPQNTPLNPIPTFGPQGYDPPPVVDGTGGFVRVHTGNEDSTPAVNGRLPSAAPQSYRPPADAPDVSRPPMSSTAPDSLYSPTAPHAPYPTTGPQSYRPPSEIPGGLDSATGPYPTTGPPSQGSAYFMGAPEIQPVGARKKRRTGLIVVIVVLAVVVLAASAVAIRVFVVAHGGTQFCQTFIGMKSQMTDLGQQMQDAVITGDFDQIGTVLGQMSDTFDQLRGTNPPASVEPALETIIDELDSMQQATSGGPLAYLEYLVVHGDDITTTFTTAGETFEKEAIAYCS